MSSSGEFDWIEKYFAPLAGSNSFKLLDDAALFPVDGADNLIVTQDAIAQDVHFLGDDPPERVAKKALRVNVSDIIAKGGTPQAYSLALGVPKNWSEAEIASFAQGLAEDQETYGLYLIGGDTFRSPGGLMVSVTMLGRPAAQNYVSRLNAKVGDQVLVSGEIGNAAIALHHIKKGMIETQAERQQWVDDYQLPVPPLGLEQTIGRYANASMDVSDGLVGDAEKICRASGVSITMDIDQVPMSARVQAEIRQNALLMETALNGGDDYQCLFTVPSIHLDQVFEEAGKLGIRLTRIGEVTNGGDAKLALANRGQPVSIGASSFAHF